MRPGLSLLIGSDFTGFNPCPKTDRLEFATSRQAKIAIVFFMIFSFQANCFLGVQRRADPDSAAKRAIHDLLRSNEKARQRK
jgi:hypothetical protein